MEQEITEERLAALHSGVIVLRHVGMPHVSWEISFEFDVSDASYSWLLDAPGLSRGIMRAGDPAARLSTTAPRPLAECLLGVDRSSGSPVSLPASLPDFDLARMCPDAGTAVAGPVVRTGTGIVDQQFTVFRRAIELLDLPTPEAAGQRMFSLAYALTRILNDGVIVVGEQLRGLGIGGSPPQQPGPYPWAALASEARSRAPWQLPLRLFELKNGSPRQRERYRRVQDTFATLAPSRRLDITFRATKMDAFQPTPLAAGQVALRGQHADDEQSGGAHPAAVITAVVAWAGEAGLHPGDLPVQLHGAGTWEALVIAEAITDAADRLVILDEPAVTLHPTWQRALRTMISGAPGQFVVITHSANLVPMGNTDDLATLVRLENETGQTTAHAFDPSSLTHDAISRVTREFSLSSDAISLLFARGVVLVEGETELGALPEWFNSHAADTDQERLASLDLGFFSVGGDKSFGTFLTVLHALGIPWVVICDGAAFDIQKRLSNGSHIFSQVLNAGIDAPELKEFMREIGQGRAPVMDQTMFTSERELGERCGIFTLARGWTVADKAGTTPGDESFEAFVEDAAPGALHQAKEAVGNSKVRKGRWLATTSACPQEVGVLYGRVITAFGRTGLSP